MKMQISQSKRRGFTLIEMIGVLAVIAILAAILVPKIFESINNARVNNAATSINTIKTALADHYAKFGSLQNANGTPITTMNSTTPYLDFDGKALLVEGFIDKPLDAKIAATSDVRLILGIAPTTVTGSDAEYDLDGDGTADVSGVTTVIAEAVLTGVPPTDAWELSKRLDGTTGTMSQPDNTTDDNKGRVKYAIDSTTKLAAVHVYLTHR
jgi:prepilin-type N-terminal cleavage/methylation domain-containing protein